MLLLLVLGAAVQTACLASIADDCQSDIEFKLNDNGHLKMCQQIL
jgi:hypothetical protein